MHCWLEYVWEVFEATRQAEFEGIKIVQALCIIHLLRNKLEGFSFRIRHLHARTVLLARRKGLHMTDAANSGMEKESGKQLELEMKRRIWWYIAATDWNLAANDGPGEGSYSIHPHQQAVKMPRNINDDDLNTQSGVFERPSAELTSMSCFLTRIGVSEVCRDIVDLQWASRLSGLAQYSKHHRVHLIDKKILEIIRNLPLELDLDHGDASEVQQQPVTIEMQRLLLNSMIYARRWHMLHCGCLDFLYFATVVLLADFCLNESDEERHTLREKIETAVKILQRARLESSMVEMYLASLSTIACRHNIHLSQPIVPQPVAP
ncbi:unnamed protein product [Clonostachys chloroleuca]|uniref:Transcription factor domain-containing protein n=1 Tax=Clonostachys chloroleuca TaxID=1926264 RepID=A0AA35MEZ7_9HYPO|nr:unnamed protein product [Clonostachys chloroleuca]